MVAQQLDKLIDEAADHLDTALMPIRVAYRAHASDSVRIPSPDPPPSIPNLSAIPVPVRAE